MESQIVPQTYILVTRPGHYWLVGPFESQAAAIVWGHHKYRGSPADERWQTIKLVSPYNSLWVLRPDHPLAAEGPMVKETL